MYVVPRSKRSHIDAVVFQLMRYRFAAAVVVAPQVLDVHPSICHHGERLRSIGHGVLSRAFQTQRHRFSVVGQTLGAKLFIESHFTLRFEKRQRLPVLYEFFDAVIAQPLRPASVALFCGSALLIALRPKIAAFQNQRIQQVFFRRGQPQGNASTHGITHNVGTALGAFMPHTRNLYQERFHHTHHGVVAIKLNVAWLTASAMPQEIKRVCAVIA